MEPVLKNMDEVTLINLVKEHGELYDPEHRQYQDNHRRDAAWKKIATRMKMQAHECRDRWKQLRENYRKALKLRQVQKAKGIKKLKAIKHGQIMAFIDERKETESEPRDTQKSKDASCSMKQRHDDKDDKDLLDPLRTLEKNKETTKNDTIITFFTNLGETVKTFPEEVQIRVKRDIFKIINEAEEEVLMNKFRARELRNNSEYGLDF